MLLAALYVLTAGISSAYASVYVTEPVAGTTYKAGQYAQISWRDDDRAPHIQDMGPMTLKLFTANDEYVATLAKDVHPSRKQHGVYLPHSLGSDNTDYVMHFVSEDPRLTVYTANFPIRPSKPSSSSKSHHTTSLYEQLAAPMAVEVSTYSDTATYTEAPIYQPVVTLFAQNETITSTLKPTKSELADTTVFEQSIAAFPTSSSSKQEADSMGTVYEQPKAKSAASSGARFCRGAGGRWWSVDAERLKFQAVFVFWPALIGVTMAL
ncbi:hypothetical protein PUNSTDRAFT_46927 [Punctularia strigosozonata HHB-11173 SS5]|uniref:uncharacterized protein n=1 Tax=Punctularia strigosozonata (strain HHB-11173) TaxID=741275 RepID=UPI0004417464|nr:uncharacterized protein PUNSTDRAFT_46927 [Punctularia strigosozonata HHB-11173 SS5]EIN05628.1 hypothetical protein PUNSTDRAFT_46927 [Punctularia strigosozonata HHB-11173 SS5]